MKKVIKLLLIVCAIFLYKSVNAATNVSVGETIEVFRNATCSITSCTSDSSTLSVNYDASVCNATGVSIGEASVTVVCSDSQTKTIALNVVDANNAGANSGGTSENVVDYSGVTSGTTNCESLGLLKDDINGIFKIFKIVAPILVIVMSVYDFVKAFTGKVEGEMKKAFMKFAKRLIFAVVLFFLPDLLDFLLSLVSDSYSTCISN